MKVRVLGNRKIVSSNPWVRTGLGRRSVYLRGNPWPWEGRGASGDLGSIGFVGQQTLDRWKRSG